jgi:hypothetical protein
MAYHHSWGALNNSFRRFIKKKTTHYFQFIFQLQWLLFGLSLTWYMILLSIMIIWLRNRNPREQPTPTCLLWLSCGWNFGLGVKQYTHLWYLHLLRVRPLSVAKLNPRNVRFGVRAPDFFSLRAAPVVLNMWPQKLKLMDDWFLVLEQLQWCSICDPGN